MRYGIDPNSSDSSEEDLNWETASDWSKDSRNIFFWDFAECKLQLISWRAQAYLYCRHKLVIVLICIFFDRYQESNSISIHCTLLVVMSSVVENPTCFFIPSSYYIID